MKLNGGRSTFFVEPAFPGLAVDGRGPETRDSESKENLRKSTSTPGKKTSETPALNTCLKVQKKFKKMRFRKSIKRELIFDQLILLC